MRSQRHTVTESRGSVGTGQPRFVDTDAVFDRAHDLLGRKWHLRIVHQLLANGPMGFSALKDAVPGISSKMLSESLTTLEDDGIVRREIVNEQPVRVEYSLTEQGAALEPVVVAVVEWGADYEPTDRDGDASGGV